MKKYLSVFLLVLFCFCNVVAQKKTCDEIYNEGLSSLSEKDYKLAIRRFLAVVAAKCDPSIKDKADQQIILAFEGIEELAVFAEKEKEKAESNLQDLSMLINDITDLLQRDENVTIIGLAPLKNDIFKNILPYQDLLKNKSSDELDNWKIAQSHFQIATALESLGRDGFNVRYKQAFLISYKYVAKYTENGINIPEKLMMTLLNSAVYYAWDLMNMNDMEQAKKIFSKTNYFVGKYNGKKMNPDLMYARTKFDNALSRFYSKIGDDKNGYLFNHKAIKKMRELVNLDENNLLYKSSLATYLRNLNVRLDSLLTPDDKSFIKEGYEIALKIKETKGTGTLGLTVLAECAYTEAGYLLKLNKYDEAIQLLEQEISELSFYINLEPLNVSLYLNRARLYTKLHSIFKYQKKSDSQAYQNIIKAKNDWLNAINDKTSIINELWIIRSIYLDYLRSIEFPVEKEENLRQKIELFKDLENAIRRCAEKNKNVHDIAFIAGDIYLNLGELKNKAGESYEIIIENLNKAIDYFEKTNILSRTDKFTENFSNYARVISQRIKLNCKYENIDLVMKDFEDMNKVFIPILEKFQFDFYLRSNIVSAYNSTGELLFKMKRYEEAKAILAYASKWGVKESSKKLASIYREGLAGEVDIKAAESLEKLANKQSMKKFTIPCEFGMGKKIPFDVFVSELPKDFKYKGIDDQAIWLKEARGGSVPEDTQKAFRTLQSIAWEKDLSYPDLCLRAMNLANQGDFDDRQSQIKLLLKNDTLSVKEKVSELEKYFTFYENSFLKKKSNKDFLEKAFNFYWKNLINLKKLKEVKNRVKKLKEIIPEFKIDQEIIIQISIAEYESLKSKQKNIDYKDFFKSDDKKDMEMYYSYFLKHKDREASIYWQSKLLKKDGSDFFRYSLSLIQISNDFILFPELYSNCNIKSIKKIISLFEKTIKLDLTDNINKKESLLKYLIKLKRQLIKISPQEDIKEGLGSDFNSLAYLQLQNSKFKEAEINIRAGLEFDTNNMYLNSNLPLSLLLQGQYRKARRLYKKWRNVAFDSDERFETCKDAFLDDFKAFKEAKIIPKKYLSDVEKIKNFLNK